ncbi:hypothetical protein BCR35DRAFT_3834 [Leucosporidium creatinivorum]|uniref:Uncharacterized protein n=1 Tax=Leucosporidium creatinivorum TaxID=106004 RepID=A0A1Y2G678_9BASI|nr:hypothetical protein BCR35DRAFT_3834 [Leucosporidium creatinivorum]
MQGERSPLVQQHTSPKRARRRASLSIFHSPPRLAPPALPKSDLRILEDLCGQSLAKCTAHEKEIEGLKHAIEGKINRWDTIVSTLKESEDKAQTLTDQIQTSLHTLRSSTTTQVNAAKDSVTKADRRVTQTRTTLEKANETIAASNKAIASLELRLRAEEVTLKQIDAATKLMLWLTAVIVLLGAVLVAWLRLPS